MAESDSFWPPLTTVHQSFEEVGRRAVATLIEQLDGRDPDGAAIVPVRLVLRESTAPAPRSA